LSSQVMTNRREHLWQINVSIVLCWL